jgi:hypothetical protein
MLQAWNFIRDFTDKPMSTLEALLSNLAKAVLDVNAGGASARRGSLAFC